MTRPTLNSDNSSRGNSFYVEGLHSSSSGWDPYADGMTEFYRGDCARIIMYCAVQEKSFKLVDLTNDMNKDCLTVQFKYFDESQQDDDALLLNQYQ